MRFTARHLRLLAIPLATGIAALPAAAQKPRPKATHATAQKPKSSAAGQTVGHGQLAGGNGRFGTVYSLKSGFNFEILDARYTLEPYKAYETLIAGTDEKLLVADIAIKNASKGDNFFNTDSMFTLVDSKNQIYQGGSLGLQSAGSKGPETTLRPGQGLGQPDLKDPLTVAWKLPAKARIVKIMVNQTRVGTSEEVFRYYIAGATKAEAGAEGDPKNVIAPLPDNVRDPSDSSGAVALDEGKATVGTYVPSGYFAVKLNGFSYSTDPLNGNPPDEGKKYAIMNLTVQSLTDKEVGMFDAQGGDSPLYELTDSDGERYRPAFYRKARLDEDTDHTFKKGDEYTFRAVFMVPKDVTLKKVVIGTGGSRKWAIDPAELFK